MLAIARIDAFDPDGGADHRTPRATCLQHLDARAAARPDRHDDRIGPFVPRSDVGYRSHDANTGQIREVENRRRCSNAGDVSRHPGTAAAAARSR